MNVNNNAKCIYVMLNAKIEFFLKIYIHNEINFESI